MATPTPFEKKINPDDTIVKNSTLMQIRCCPSPIPFYGREISGSIPDSDPPSFFSESRSITARQRIAICLNTREFDWHLASNVHVSADTHSYLLSCMVVLEDMNLRNWAKNPVNKYMSNSGVIDRSNDSEPKIRKDHSAIDGRGRLARGWVERNRTFAE
jgi:hypothetical protein